jgi:DNA-binding winged helix-turn-helix (wHTH) protein
MEFELLRLLTTHPNRVFPRETLLNKVWGYDNYPTTRTVDNHIAQLRHKFEPDLFETVRGVGYRFLLRPSQNDSRSAGTITTVEGYETTPLKTGLPNSERNTL